MASKLIMPHGVVQTNLHLNPETDKVQYIDSDTYHLGERLAEISPNLYVIGLTRNTRESKSFSYAIMERCQDGVDRVIMRLKRGELDGRVLERLRYMMSVDLHTRIDILDKEREKLEAEQHDNELEELYERMGGEMLITGANTNFWQRPESYRPMNRTARRHGRRMT